MLTLAARQYFSYMLARLVILASTVVVNQAVQVWLDIEERRQQQGDQRWSGIPTTLIEIGHGEFEFEGGRYMRRYFYNQRF